VEVSKNSVASPACTASLPLPSGKHKDFIPSYISFTEEEGFSRYEIIYFYK